MHEPNTSEREMMQLISGTCYEHGPWTGPGMCPKCPKLTVSYPPTYEEGYAAGLMAGLERAAKALKDDGDYNAPYFIAVISRLLDEPQEPK